MQYNPDEQKNIGQFKRTEEDKHHMRYEKHAGWPPWSRVLTTLGAVALVIVLIIIFG